MLRLSNPDVIWDNQEICLIDSLESVFLINGIKDFSSIPLDSDSSLVKDTDYRQSFLFLIHCVRPIFVVIIIISISALSALFISSLFPYKYR